MRNCWGAPCTSASLLLPLLLLTGLFRIVSSFFQSVCVLGYCIFPLIIATALLLTLKLVISHVILRLLLVSIGFVWSTRGPSSCPLVSASALALILLLLCPFVPLASVVFMSKMVPPKRKALTVYPVLLFYLFIAWMVLIQ